MVCYDPPYDTPIIHIIIYTPNGPPCKSAHSLLPLMIHYDSHLYTMILIYLHSSLLYCLHFKTLSALHKYINQEGRQLRVNQQCPFDLCGISLECLQNLISALEYLIAVQLKWFTWSVATQFTSWFKQSQYMTYVTPTWNAYRSS